MSDIKEIQERIEWLEDDITCLQNIIKSETDSATVKECIQRISTDRDKIKMLEKELG